MNSDQKNNTGFRLVAAGLLLAFIVVFSTAATALVVDTGLDGTVTAGVGNGSAQTDATMGVNVNGAMGNGSADALVSATAVVQSEQDWRSAQAQSSEKQAEYAEVKNRWGLAVGPLRLQLEAELVAKGKTALKSQVDTVVAYLQALKTRGVVGADLDARIEYWDRFKSRVDADLQSKQELKSFSEEARETWMQQRWEIKKNALLSVRARMETIIEQTEALSLRLESRIAELKADGKQTAVLESGLQALKTDLQLFSEASASLDSKLNAAVSEENRGQVVSSAEHMVNAMHARMKQDFVLIKSLLHATTELNAAASVSAQTESSIRTSSTVPATGLQAAMHSLSQVRVNGEVE